MNETQGESTKAWRTLGLMLAVGALAIAVGFWARKVLSPQAVGIAGSATAVAEGSKQLEFSLDSLDGERVTAADFSGRVVVVDFWATWCGPCKIQGEILHALQERYEAQAVSFLAINVGESEDLVRDYVAEDPFNYRVIMDPAQTLSGKYGIYALPTVMVLDRDQGILFKNMGVSSGDQVSAVIERALEAG